MKVLDLFAGPGGWDIAARDLGLDVLGIEWDDAACATRKAAGLRTLRRDVSALSPRNTKDLWVQREPSPPLAGLIASPPCQAWSMAGKGGGRRDKQHVVQCAGELAAGTDTRAEHRANCEDERSILAVEPLRWALALRPEWCAFEQVPPVLELWTMFAQILSQYGYKTWAGILEAERYGVPQTRERAILLASRVGSAHPPQATHQRYVPGEPQRHEFTMDGEILPWVSMAQALGWAEGPSPSPSPSVTGGGGATGGVEVFASKAARARATAAVIFQSNQSIAGEGRAERHQDEPCVTISGTQKSARWVPTHYDRRQGNTLPNGERQMVRPIPVSDPAPAIGAQGLAKGRDVWVHERPAPTIVTTRRSDEGLIVGRQLPPGEGRNIGGHGWAAERPATTVNGDPRISEPGRHDPNISGSQQANAVRVTAEEAAALQTFPAGYPFQGSRTKVFEQIGNAIPPLLAWHVLRSVVPVVSEAAA